MNPTIKVAVSSKTSLMRKGVTALLQNEKDLQVLFNAANKKEVIDHLKYKVPHVLVISIEKTEPNILQTLMALKVFPQIRLIALIENANDALILKLLELDVKSILTKEVDAKKLIEAIKEVHSKGFHYSNEIMRVISKRVGYLSEPLPDCGITTRESEVLLLVCQGKSSKQIAELLFISTKTVESHRHNLLRKIGSKNELDLKHWAENVES